MYVRIQGPSTALLNPNVSILFLIIYILIHIFLTLLEIVFWSYDMLSACNKRCIVMVGYVARRFRTQKQEFKNIKGSPKRALFALRQTQGTLVRSKQANNRLMTQRELNIMHTKWETKYGNPDSRHRNLTQEDRGNHRTLDRGRKPQW